MELKNILEYQNIDAKLFQLEKQLNLSVNKKKCNELSAVAKESQVKSASLEQQAAKVAKEIQELFKIADQNKAKLKEIISHNVEKLSAQQVEQLLVLRDKLLQNLTIIDKKATKLAEMANSILAEFNKTKQSYKLAGEKFHEFMLAYEKEVEEAKPKIEELQTELKKIEKNIDPSLIDSYKKRRADKIFPVLVPLNNKCCGGCHMEVPASSISTLQRDGILVCEHCRRIIFN